jgi:hypothetical protein
MRGSPIAFHHQKLLASGQEQASAVAAAAAAAAAATHQTRLHHALTSRRWGWSQPAKWVGAVACLPLFMGWGAGISQPWAYKRAIDFQHLDTRKCRQGPTEVRFFKEDLSFNPNPNHKSHDCMYPV